MKNLLDAWIIKRAEKIKAKELIARTKADQAWKFEADRWTNAKNRAIDLIIKKLEPSADKFEKEPCHIEVGDVAIMNIYSIFGSRGRSWDGGPYSYLNYIDEDEKTEPISVTITKIVVDWSYTRELIDKFIDIHQVDLLEWAIKHDSLFSNFVDWATRNSTFGLDNGCGLYKTAYFETQTRFKPTWGLNISSFLKLYSEEGQLTSNIWHEEIELNTIQKQLNEKLESIRLRKIEIDTKYKGIIYSQEKR